MYLKSIELAGFKSFGKKSEFIFQTSVTAIVGPNGSGKSNVAEAFRFVLGEQSFKSMRGKRGEDLIFSGTQMAPRANRASVKLVFDNKGRLLDIDFDQVVIERVVHRDGVNEYLINGSRVRLKDVIEMLAGANIGASGHHIISQGEADRILSAGVQDRREMIEDALGLRVYQYKKHESVKKLEKTLQNKKEVESLRKENAPHLKFLAKQVEKIERAKSLREELLVKYKDYLKREEVHLQATKEQLALEENGPRAELETLEVKLEELRKTIESSKEDKDSQELLDTERALSEARRSHESKMRELGRLEGQVMFEENRLEEEKRKSREEKLVPLRDFERCIGEVTSEIEQTNESTLAGLLERVRGVFDRFIDAHKDAEFQSEEAEARVEKLKVDQEQLKKEVDVLAEKLSNLERAYQAVRDKINAQKDEGHEAEREMFVVMTKQNELRSKLSENRFRREQYERDLVAFRAELTEGSVLVGRAILEYEAVTISNEEIGSEARDVQLERRHELEKMKIRLEELGGGAVDEVLREYKETKERDEFLAKEIADLEASVASLEKLIEELDIELHTKFKEGIEKINKEFNEFFGLMFGGGSAALTLVKQKSRGDDLLDEEEEDRREGIDLEVSLPRKRIKGLMMLSGGERALTSIALIFAMSQVNPPPFLILDETDAALDEANSRRYGDMIENLSKRSQLIVITHNRETMSRAGVLYGVTMGADGVSKTLSVKFEEAVQVAK